MKKIISKFKHIDRATWILCGIPYFSLAAFVFLLEGLGWGLFSLFCLVIILIYIAWTSSLD